MPDLFLSVLDLFGDTKWGWIALTAALLSLAFGFLTNIITAAGRAISPATSSGCSGLSTSRLREIRELTCRWSSRLITRQRLASTTSSCGLKELGYLRDSNIKAGFFGHRPVWITADDIRRATSRR